MRTSLRAVAALFASVALSAPALAQGPVIEISGANFRPLPIAVPAPQLTTTAPKARVAEFDQALQFDLNAASIFQVLDRGSFLADAKEGFTASSIQFNRWADIGAEALVKVQLSADKTQLKGELKLFTVGSGTEAFKTSHQVPLTQPRQLAHKLADDVFRHFTREPGAFQSKLTFVRKTAKGKDVYLADWDGKNAQALTNGGINVLPALGPGGGWVLYTSYRSGRPLIYSQRPGGAPSVLLRSDRMITGAAYSPDGRKLAYALAQGESSNIFVADADGSNPKQLTATPLFLNSSPSWSPDGNRLAFVSNRAGSPQIYVMNAADGGDVKRLTFQGDYNQTPDWSPRGDLIAFTARDERLAFDVFTVNVDNGKITRITQDQGNNEEPTFSPNGRLIIFSSDRQGAPRLFVSTIDGTKQLVLPGELSQVATPDWGS